MKIAIIGNYGATNIGDEAILQSILKNHSEHQWTIFSADPKKTEKNYQSKSVHHFPLGFRSFFRYGFRPSWKALKKCEAVVIGGGGLMQDDYWYACFLWAWQAFWVKWFNKPYFIYATGVGPLKSRVGRWLTKYVYKSAVGITVRDQRSFNTLKNLGLPTDNIEITADPAFLLKVPKIDSTDGREPHTYMISIRPWLNYNRNIIDVFTRFLSRLKQGKKAKIVFVAMQNIKEKDHLVIDPIIERVGGELFIPRDFDELLCRLQKVEFAIGMRYHFLLAAMITKTPSLAISYAHKVENLFKNSNLEPYHLPLSELSSMHLEKKMARLSVDYNNVKVYQKSRLDELKQSSNNNLNFFDGFVKVLTDPQEADSIAEPLN